MASRKSKGRKAAPAEDEPTQNAVADTAAEAEPVEDAATQSVAAAAPIEYDAAASERSLTACSGIYSSSTTAVSEAMDAASVFLNFAQKARIRALSVDFETRRLASAAPTATAPATAAVSTAAVESGLDQDAVERIVSHRVDLAVQQVLQGLGVSQGQTLQSELEKQLQGQESRLLDYVKRHLTESLEMLESSLDDRIGELLDGEDASNDDEARARAEVEEQVEAAKEELEKNISEVRDVEMGFNLSEFMDGVAGMVSADSSGDGLDEEIELGGDSMVVEAPEVELGGEDIELGGDDIELGGDDIELGGDDEEVAADDEDEDDAGPTIAADDDLSEVVADVRELAEVDPDISSGAAHFVDLPMQAEEIELGGEEAAEDDEIDLSDENEATSDDIEFDAAEADSNLELEEADGDSVVDLDLDSADVEQIPDDAADAVELDLADDDGDAGELELEEDSAADDGAIDRYLQRAAEMRERQQSAAAMELYNKVLDIDEDNYEARIGRGVLHLESKDYKRAIDQFTKAESIDPSRPASSLGLAEVHFHRKQFNKAIRHYTQTLKLDDTLAQAYCNRGLSYYYQKNYKKAFLDLMRAYDIDPDLPNIKKYLKLVRNKVKTDS